MFEDWHLERWTVADTAAKLGSRGEYSDLNVAFSPRGPGPKVAASARMP